MPNIQRLQNQLSFILEIDKLKSILRQTTLTFDPKRKENDAEHSWHIALMAAILAEHSNVQVDVLRVIKMLLIHDIVEIDVGDTFVYDKLAAEGKYERERAAAERLFGMLPEDQSAEMIGLWEEFEKMQTPESRFAAALDRLQPMMLNFHTQGGAWQKHGVTSDRVHERNRHIAEGSEALWEYAANVINRAVEFGWLDEPSEGKNKDRV